MLCSSQQLPMAPAFGTMSGPETAGCGSLDRAPFRRDAPWLGSRLALDVPGKL